MARRVIRKYLPHLEWVRTHRHLNFLGKRLHEPNLWHLNRASVSKAAAIGLFIAFIPMPFQMVPAALGAILFGANLPIAVALVWITNPLTMPPIFFFCYKLGTWLLQTPARDFAFEISFAWINQELHRVWQPLLLGSVLTAMVASATGYYTVRALWRRHVLRDWDQRRRRQLRRRTAARAPEA
jgi:uncharacterized protein (DUF2062 family)